MASPLNTCMPEWGLASSRAPDVPDARRVRSTRPSSALARPQPAFVARRLVFGAGHDAAQAGPSGSPVERADRDDERPRVRRLNFRHGNACPRADGARSRLPHAYPCGYPQRAWTTFHAVFHGKPIAWLPGACLGIRAWMASRTARHATSLRVTRACVAGTGDDRMRPCAARAPPAAPTARVSAAHARRPQRYSTSTVSRFNGPANVPCRAISTFHHTPEPLKPISALEIVTHCS